MKASRLFAALTLSVAMLTTPISAQQHRSAVSSRNSNSGQKVETPKRESATANRGSSSASRNDNRGSNVRPGNDNRNNNNGNRNNNYNDRNKDYRHGNNGHSNNNDRYGNRNDRNDYRPGGYKPPVNNGRPHNDYRPAPGPQYRPYTHGHICPPPPRPYRPAYRPIVRPVIPAGYVYYHDAPLLTNILGLAFGLAYNASLDYLYDRGYSIDGYDNDAIYLRDIREMGYNWEDGILNYANGRLYGAQFINSTRGGSRSRYNRLYRELCYRYGNPIAFSGNRSGATWFSRDGRTTITLDFGFDYVGGYGRYFTTLSYDYL